MKAETVVLEMRQSIEGDGKIGPGTPAAFGPANTPGDCIAQGDVDFTLIDAIPTNYERRMGDSVALVFGEASPTHALEDASAVEFFDPPNWGPESLDGPCLRVNREVRVLHSGGGHHGPVTLTPACYEVTYPRVWEREQAREMRARD